jgi:small subunit ribosomal protein S17
MTETPASTKGTTVTEPSSIDGSPNSERNTRKTREGLVVSDKMDKTVVVSVEDRVKHALYGKVLRRTRKLKAHDEQNQCGIGDRVLIMETRPLSATKRWRVVTVLEKAQ